MLWCTARPSILARWGTIRKLFLYGNNAWSKPSVLVVVVDFHKDGRRVVQNENGVTFVPLPSQAVCGIELDVLHDSGRINRGLPPADSDGTPDAHRPAHEKHCRQASRCVHVGHFEK